MLTVGSPLFLLKSPAMFACGSVLYVYSLQGQCLTLPPGQPPYILVTELMYGGSLQDALDRNISFSVRRALEMALDCARGWPLPTGKLSFGNVAFGNLCLWKSLSLENFMW